MNWNEYPLIRVLIPFIIGICIAYFQFIPFHFSYFYIIPLFSIFFVFVFYLKKRIAYTSNFILGIYLNLMFVFCGIILTQNHFPFHKPDYFGNHIKNSNYFVGVISEPIEEKEKSLQLTVNIIGGGNDTNFAEYFGRSIVYIPKDSSSGLYSFGDKILIVNNFQEIKKSGNPYQFDYKQYLRNKGINFQQYLKSGSFRILEKSYSVNLYTYTYKARDFLLNILRKRIPGKDEQAIAFALMLGERNYISEELQMAYSSAGAVHVLSVSGLHVGIIFLILNQILMLFPMFKNKSITKAILIILFIWAFAFISGLSSSVMRASWMISFVVIGSNLNRPTNVYNSIAFSAFLLLFFNPFILFDVGFQLSYMAVISIVSLQPFFYKLWLPNSKLLDKMWALTTVSVAAQIGTLPFTLLYFNQFPTYFILANFIVIPGAFAILMLGIVTMIFAWLNPVVNILGILLGYIIYWMNQYILFIERLPFSVIAEIFFNSSHFIFTAFLLIAFGNLLLNKKKWGLYLGLVSIIGLLTTSIFVKKDILNNKEMIFYDSKKSNIFMFVDKDRAVYFVDSLHKNSLQNASFEIRRHKILSGIEQWETFELREQSEIWNQNVLKKSQFIIWENKRFALLSPQWQLPEVKNPIRVDYVILYNNPKFKVEELLKSYDTKNVILSSKNFDYLNKKYQKELTENGIQVYLIPDKGAFRLKS